jgi:hypothetical protein
MRVMDQFDLSRKMRRLTAWLDTQNQPDGMAGRRFHGVPFAGAYLTIDPGANRPTRPPISTAFICAEPSRK